MRDSTKGVTDTGLYYEIAGEGPPLVFVHGFSLDTRMWDDQVETFSERYRVIRYDIRGYGRSVVPTGPYDHSEDLMSLFRLLDLSQAHICGLSMGGGLSLNFVLAHPEATSSLTLVDSNLGGYQWSHYFEGLLDAVWSEGRKVGVEEAKKLWLRMPIFKQAMGDPRVSPRLLQMIKGYSGWHWTNNDPRQTIDPPAIRRLTDVRVPTLVLVGEHDEPDFHMVADLLAQGIPKARKMGLKGVGHMANMERPEQFNEALRHFLNYMS